MFQFIVPSYPPSDYCRSFLLIVVLITELVCSIRNYVHNLPLLFCFIFFFMIVNRRLDEWVKLDQLDLDSVEAVVDEKVEDKVTCVL